MFRALTTLPVLLALVSAVGTGLAVPASVNANERVGLSRGPSSLSTPITGARLDAMWPIEVDIEIVRIADEPGGKTKVVLPRHRAKVPDGHAMQLHSVVQTDTGRREFALDVTAHHHPDAVELEWSLEVLEARYRPIDVASYLLHRLQLDDVLELDEASLAIARADIVEVTDEPHTRRVLIGSEVHEIRIFARSARG